MPTQLLTAHPYHHSAIIIFSWLLDFKWEDPALNKPTGIGWQALDETEGHEQSIYHPMFLAGCISWFVTTMNDHQQPGYHESTISNSGYWRRGAQIIDSKGWFFEEIQDLDGWFHRKPAIWICLKGYKRQENEGTHRLGTVVHSSLGRQLAGEVMGSPVQKKIGSSSMQLGEGRLISSVRFVMLHDPLASTIISPLQLVNQGLASTGLWCLLL